MNNPEANEPKFVSFDCEMLPCPPGTPAGPRPAGRPRDLYSGAVSEPKLVSFEERFDLAELTESDSVFARDLANRVIEYTRSHTVDGAGPTPEQIAALVQQFLTRRAS